MNDRNFKTGWKITAWGAVLICAAILLSFLATSKDDNMKKDNAAGYIGRAETEIRDGRMTPEVLLTLGRLSDPQPSPDGRHILYGVSYTSISEDRSCRNLFICGTDGADRQQLTFSGKSISNARWCCGGSRIMYVKDGQIWSSEIRHGRKGWTLKKEVQISDIPSGVMEFKLSPDGNKLMYSTMVQSFMKRPGDLYPDAAGSSAIITDDLMYRHWDHWAKEVPHTFVAGCDPAAGKSILPENSTDILQGEAFPYELPAEPFSGLEQLCWSPDGSHIAYSCKKMVGKRYAFSTDSEIYLYRVSDGRTLQVTHGGGYDTDPSWSPDGSRLCWVSMERDGYEADKQRLMLSEVTWSQDREGIVSTTEGKDLTSNFKYNVSGPVWTSDSRSVYFAALAEGLQGIFRIDLSGKVDRITGDDLWYDFDSPFHISENDGKTTLLTSWCSLMFPQELVSLEISGKEVTVNPVTQENRHLLEQLDEPSMEARHIRTVDGKDMLTWVVYPPHFDPSKTYPAIEICLGGPQGTLSQGWSYRWNYRLMASQGYVVVMPNRRGTTAFGQEWTEQISGDYCGLNMQDYLSAAREIKSESYIGKIAACGASYGGYSVYYLMGIHENTFDAFIAHAGIFNEEHMYMTTEEMWFPNWDNGGLHEYEADSRVGTADCPMGAAGDGQTFGGIRQGGSPWSDLKLSRRHYDRSPHRLVENWDTPILVTHGGMDFRVPYDQGMAAYNAAQMMGVPSRLIVFPDENHWILKPQNALFWHREYFKWLDEWCK